jgi:hypothetical protein
LDRRQTIATATLFPGPSWRAFYPFSHGGADASNRFDGVFEGNATSQTDPFFRGQIDALVLHQSRPHCVGVPDAPKGLRRIPTRMNR